MASNSASVRLSALARAAFRAAARAAAIGVSTSAVSRPGLGFDCAAGRSHAAWEYLDTAPRLMRPKAAPIIRPDESAAPQDPARHHGRHRRRKSPDLVRRLMDHGAQVQVVMSRGAQQFVTALTFQAVSGRPVRTDLWDEAAEAAMGHIELARWADEIVVAPATAEFIARLAHGFADDLLATVCLATTARITLAPAMNRQMWRTQPLKRTCRKIFRSYWD